MALINDRVIAPREDLLGEERIHGRGPVRERDRDRLRPTHRLLGIPRCPCDQDMVALGNMGHFPPRRAHETRGFVPQQQRGLARVVHGMELAVADPAGEVLDDYLARAGIGEIDFLNPQNGLVSGQHDDASGGWHVTTPFVRASRLGPRPRLRDRRWPCHGSWLAWLILSPGAGTIPNALGTEGDVGRKNIEVRITANVSARSRSGRCRVMGRGLSLSKRYPTADLAVAPMARVDRRSRPSSAARVYRGTAGGAVFRLVGPP